MFRRFFRYSVVPGKKCLYGLKNTKIQIIFGCHCTRKGGSVKYRYTFMALLMVLLCAAPSYAQYVRAEGSVEVSPGVLPMGDVYIDIYMDNEDENWQSLSVPFALYSPDGSITNIVHRDVGGFGEDHSVILENGFEPGPESNPFSSIQRHSTGRPLQMQRCRAKLHPNSRQQQAREDQKTTPARVRIRFQV